MATLISTERLDKHEVQKYNFKVLSHGNEEEFTSALVSDEASREEDYTEDKNPNR